MSDFKKQNADYAGKYGYESNGYETDICDASITDQRLVKAGLKTLQHYKKLAQ